jgi:DNA mismatch repair ATPase MutS
LPENQPGVTHRDTQVIALGYSVGRVEEMARTQGGPAAAAAGRKLLERRLVRIYTPGTAVDSLLAVRGTGGCNALCLIEQACWAA